MRPSSCARVVVTYCLTAVLLPAAVGMDRKEVVRQARQSYYSLQREDVSGFQCQVAPDFESMFKAVKTDAVGREQVLPILKKTSFQILVGPDGASSVSHQSEIAPPNEEVAERVVSRQAVWSKF